MALAEGLGQERAQTFIGRGRTGGLECVDEHHHHLKTLRAGRHVQHALAGRGSVLHVRAVLDHVAHQTGLAFAAGPVPRHEASLGRGAEVGAGREQLGRQRPARGLDHLLGLPIGHLFMS
ncbi:hypothetical protein D9M69_661830 [compost metagenome]